MSAVQPEVRGRDRATAGREVWTPNCGIIRNPGFLLSAPCRHLPGWAPWSSGCRRAESSFRCPGGCRQPLPRTHTELGPPESGRPPATSRNLVMRWVHMAMDGERGACRRHAGEPREPTDASGRRVQSPHVPKLRGKMTKPKPKPEIGLAHVVSSSKQHRPSTMVSSSPGIAVVSQIPRRAEACFKMLWRETEPDGRERSPAWPVSRHRVGCPPDLQPFDLVFRAFHEMGSDTLLVR